MPMRAFRYHSIEPEGLWTSDPFPAAERRHIVQGVIGGFLSGRPRWATDLDGNFIYGLDAKGKEMKAAPSVRAAPPRRHSTKKKSSAQLDREIAEALAGGTSSPFEAAKTEQAAIEKEVDAASETLRAFPRGPMGLVPDAVKATPEYRAANARFQRAFARQREFNTVFTKRFAKELRAERASRYGRG